MYLAFELQLIHTVQITWIIIQFFIQYRRSFSDQSWTNIQVSSPSHGELEITSKKWEANRIIYIMTASLSVCHRLYNLFLLAKCSDPQTTEWITWTRHSLKRFTPFLGSSSTSQPYYREDWADDRPHTPVWDKLRVASRETCMNRSNRRWEYTILRVVRYIHPNISWSAWRPNRVPKLWPYQYMVKLVLYSLQSKESEARCKMQNRG